MNLPWDVRRDAICLPSTPQAEILVKLHAAPRAKLYHLFSSCIQFYPLSVLYQDWQHSVLFTIFMCIVLQCIVSLNCTNFNQILEVTKKQSKSNHQRKKFLTFKASPSPFSLSLFLLSPYPLCSLFLLPALLSLLLSLPPQVEFRETWAQIPAPHLFVGWSWLKWFLNPFEPQFLHI